MKILVFSEIASLFQAMKSVSTNVLVIIVGLKANRRTLTQMIKFLKPHKDEVTKATIIKADYASYNINHHFMTANIYGDKVPEYKYSNKKVTKYTAVVDIEQDRLGKWIEYRWEGTKHVTKEQAKKEMTEFLLKFKSIDSESIDTDKLYNLFN